MTEPVELSPTADPATAANPRRWLILAVLCLALLVLVIDNTVLNVAIPTLIQDLHASNADVQWMIDAYTLPFAGLLLTAGALSDRHGRRRGLVVGLVIFGAASLGATFAGSPGGLIAARAIMGVGGAFLMPGTLSILTTVFDDSERKKAIAIWSSVLMLGALGGPTFGGLLLQHFWWGSVFLVNVPVAALGIVAVLAIIPESRGQALRPDPLGAVLSMGGMTGLVWGIISGPRDGWSDLRTVLPLVLGVLLLAAFALWERRVAVPMLPTQLFANRDFSGACLSVVLLSFASGGILLAITQYLQFVLGYSPIRAGLALLPLLGAAMAFNGIGVLLDKRFGPRLTIAAGLLLVAAGFGYLSTISADDGYGTFVVAMILTGIGSGTAGPAAYGTLLGALPHDRAGVGSAVNDTVQQTGQALSVAVLGSLLSAGYTAKLPDRFGGVARNSLGEALQVAAARGDRALAVAARHAFVDAMSIASYAGVAGGVGASVVALTVIRSHRRPATEQPAESQPKVSA